MLAGSVQFAANICCKRRTAVTQGAGPILQVLCALRTAPKSVPPLQRRLPLPVQPLVQDITGAIENSPVSTPCHAASLSVLTRQ